jgi:lipoprotein NlpI
VAGLYAWRAKHAVDADEKMQLRNTADLAFRQAFAICPYSPEAIYNYTMFPVKCKRADDAFLLVKTSLRLDPDNSQLRDLIKWIRAAQ